MPKKTIVDWENLPKDEQVEVCGLFLVYFSKFDSERGSVFVRAGKNTNVVVEYPVRDVVPLNKEYVTVVEDWSVVKVDSRVRCRQLGSPDWVHSHFASIDTAGKVWVYPMGHTCWTHVKTQPLESYDITELIDE